MLNRENSLPVRAEIELLSPSVMLLLLLLLFLYRKDPAAIFESVLLFNLVSFSGLKLLLALISLILVSLLWSLLLVTLRSSLSSCFWSLFS